MENGYLALQKFFGGFEGEMVVQPHLEWRHEMMTAIRRSSGHQGDLTAAMGTLALRGHQGVRIKPVPTHGTAEVGFLAGVSV